MIEQCLSQQLQQNSGTSPLLPERRETRQFICPDEKLVHLLKEVTHHSMEFELQVISETVRLAAQSFHQSLKVLLSMGGSSGSRGGAEGAMAPPGPVKISHKKDGRQRRPHRFHVSWPPPYPAAGSATGVDKRNRCFSNRLPAILGNPILWTV